MIARGLVCLFAAFLTWEVSGLVVDGSDTDAVSVSTAAASAAPSPAVPTSSTAAVGDAAVAGSAPVDPDVAPALLVPDPPADLPGSVVADEAAFLAVLESRRELAAPLPVAETAGSDDWVVIRAHGKPSTFEVHPSIAADVQALVDHAAADGIKLGGWGGRSHQRQHELRKRNGCPDGWTHSEDENPAEWAPASRCRVPTARPGSSNHESGKAIDFTYGGRVIGSFSSPAFKWLEAHAAEYGLRHRIRREPWHWSPTGR